MHILHTRRFWLATLAVKIFVVTTFAISFALLSNRPSAHAQIDSQWVHNFTSSQEIEITSIALSAGDEIHIAGTFFGTIDLDPGAGQTLLVSSAHETSFIAKYDRAGNLVWAHRLFGSDDLRINDIVVDPTMHIGVVGSFKGEADLDPGPGAFQAESEGDNDIFLLRLLPDGNLQWAWTAGDSDSDIAFAVTADSNSGLYLTGKFAGTIFFQAGSSPTYDHNSNGGADVFVARFNAVGTLFWVRVFGGDGDDKPSDIGLDRAGNVYYTGTFREEVDLDPLWTSLEVRSYGRDDIFVTALTISGGFLWSTQLGGMGTDDNPRLVVEPDGSLYVSGNFEQSADFDRVVEGGVINSRGLQDIFLAHFVFSTVPRFQWAYGIGGGQSDSVSDIAQDEFGNVYLLGIFGGTADFDPGVASNELTSSGAADIFLAKYTDQGQLQRVQGMVNPQNDRASAIAISSTENVLFAGAYSGTIDLGNSLSVSTGQPVGITNAFVAHYARDTWTPFPQRAYLPEINADAVAR